MRYWLAIYILLMPLQKLAAQDTVLHRHLLSTDYFNLRDALDKKRSTLDIASRLYYDAMVDNAFNRNELALRRADSFLALSVYKWDPRHILRLEEMMMDSYVKTYRYKDASHISGVIMEKYTDAGREGLANARKIWEALQDVPPQTVSFHRSFSLPIIRNAINLYEIPIRIGSSPQEQFIFDTGANISTISESFAEKLGLRQLDVNFNVNAGQGKRVRSGLAIADSLWLGAALFRNVVFIVMPDEKLNFPQAGVRLNGIIGFPVINALKEVHISAKDHLLSVPLQPAGTHVQNLALNGLTPLLQTRTDKNDTLIFQFDTGAAFTHLFTNYFEKYSEHVLNNSRRDRKKLMSAGGGRNMNVYNLYKLRLRIGDDKAELSNVTVYTRDVHGAGQGIAIGNMGQDVISQFREMVLNFQDMYIDFR